MREEGPQKMQPIYRPLGIEEALIASSLSCCDDLSTIITAMLTCILGELAYQLRWSSSISRFLRCCTIIEVCGQRAVRLVE